MNICSPELLTACFVAAVLFSRLKGKLPRQLFLSGLNAAFLYMFVPNPESWAAFAVFIVGTYGVLWRVRRHLSGGLVLFAIVVVVAAFLLIKRYTFVKSVVPANMWEHAIEMIGLSWMLFKFIHMLVDTWQEQLEPCSLFSYANYQLGFFTLMAGPIQRYNDFYHSWERMDQSPGDAVQVLQAWNRLLTGFFKIGCLATLAYLCYEKVDGNWGPQAPSRLLLRFLILFYSYAIFLYFNFSGYCDIVIGCGRLFGFELPENFNWPFLARNVIDFWNRWHITLTHWIRDYVFMTSYKACAEKFPRSSNTIGYFLLALALFLAGLWHGSTANFAVFGILQGAGAMAGKIYGDVLKWRLGRAGFVRYEKNQWFRAIAIFMTFNFFCFSLLFFAKSVPDTLKILGTVWQGVTHPGFDPSRSNI